MVERRRGRYRLPQRSFGGANERIKEVESGREVGSV